MLTKEKRRRYSLPLDCLVIIIIIIIVIIILLLLLLLLLYSRLAVSTSQQMPPVIYVCFSYCSVTKDAVLLALYLTIKVVWSMEYGKLLHSINSGYVEILTR